MKIVLEPDEKIDVEFSETDGMITVRFDQDGIRVVESGVGDTKTIYLETFEPSKHFGD